MLVMKAIIDLVTIQILPWKKKIDDENVSNASYLHKNEKMELISLTCKHQKKVCNSCNICRYCDPKLLYNTKNFQIGMPQLKKVKDDIRRQNIQYEISRKNVA